MLASKGLITPPCGVPVSGSQLAPSSNTLARRNARTSSSTRPSATSCTTSASSRSWSMVSKCRAMSASTTHTNPAFSKAATRRKASLQLRPRRKPLLVSTSEDRLHHIPKHPVLHPIPYRRHPQRSCLSSPRLRGVAPSHWCRPVAPARELAPELGQGSLSSRLESSNAHNVTTGGTPVAPHLLPRRLQVPPRTHLVHQAEPPSSFHPSLDGLQHARCPHGGFDPGPTASRLSTLSSRRRHSRWCSFPSCVHHASTSLSAESGSSPAEQRFTSGCSPPPSLGSSHLRLQAGVLARCGLSPHRPQRRPGTLGADLRAAPAGWRGWAGGGVRAALPCGEQGGRALDSRHSNGWGTVETSHQLLGGVWKVN